jgi:phosphoglucosamine mutase
MKKLFGTDGVRGVANSELTPEMAFELGRAGAYVLHEKFPNKKVILVGKDTRISSDLLEHALISGISSVGFDVLRVGVLPTPGIAYLTRHLKACGGVVISASHNPPEYNGIKFFDAYGFKLSEKMERRIEATLGEVPLRPVGRNIGRIKELGNPVDIYVDYLVNTVIGGLENFSIAIDCGNGATYEASPLAFRELGARVLAVNTSPDGFNINVECGSTYPHVIKEIVETHDVALGISHDGDGDRVIAVDEEGKIVDGDTILAIAALHMQKTGELRNNLVVGTVMSNLGLEIALKERGIKFIRTPVGDRYVLEAMREHGAVLGGEQSGHIIFLSHSTTGDGILTGLQLLSVVRDEEKELSQLRKVLKPYPQVLKSVKVKDKKGVMENPKLLKVISEAKRELGEKGRILVRPSGTEPLIRVMVEAEEEKMANEVVDFVVKMIEKEKR